MARSAQLQLSGQWLAFAFLLLAGGIGFLWHSANSAYEAAVLRERGRELQSIAELKIGFIRSWLDERRSDARLHSRRPLFATALTGRDADKWQPGLAALPIQLEAIRSEYGYESIMLLDREGKLRFSAGTLSESALATAVKAGLSGMAEGQSVISRAYHTETGDRRHVDIDIAAPIFTGGQAEARVVGALVLHLDPKAHLDDVLNNWPGASASGESFLVERSNGELTYLSSLRRPEKARIHMSLDDPSLPAAMAARGEQGITEGIDYRGVPVLAAIGQVPDMPWFIVAKLDREEVLVPARREALWSGTLAALLVLALGLATFSWHRRSRNELSLAQEAAGKAALAASETRFRRLHEHAWDFNALLDRDMVIHYVSPSLERSLGLPALGKTISVGTSRVHPDDLARVEAARRAALKQPGKPQFVRHRFADHDGHWLTLEACFTNHLGDPEIGALAYTARDITQQLETERALHESEVRLRTIFEHAPLGIAIVNAKGRYLMVNPAHCRMLGCSESELLGKTFRDISHADDADLNEKMALDMIQGRTDHFTLEKRYLRKDGQPVWVVLSVGAVRDETGALLYFIGLLQDITERKMMENALRESEARYRFLFAGSPLPMWIYDLETLAFIEVNDAAIAHYGYAREEFLSMTLRDMAPPERVEAMEAAIRQPDEVRWGRIWTHRRKDGSLIEVAIWSRSMDYAGRPARIVLTEDVTERVKAEVALAESEARLRAIFDNAPVGLVLSGPDGRIQMPNRAMCRLLGYTQDELNGKTFLDITYPEDRYPNAELRQRLFGGEIDNFTLQKRYVRKDGGIVWTNLIVGAILHPSILPKYAIAIVQDITERKQAEEALQASEARLRAIFDSAPVGIAIADASGRYLMVNRAQCRMLGYTEAELLQRHFTDITHPEDVQANLDLSSRLRGGEISVGSVEKRYVRKDGTTFWILLTIGLVRTADGEVIGSVGVAQDITELREAEARRLEYARLQRDTLVREVHHRIKNHLQGLAGLLRQHIHNQPELEPVLKKFAAQINAISIVHGLQGRTERGNPGLRSLVSEIAAFLGGIMGARICLSCPDRDCRWAVAEAEAVPLALILNELLTNALRHGTDKAQVSLAIRCDEDKAILILKNPGRLGAELDFSGGKGLGTGLSLIRSLLPPAGAALSLENTEDGWVETRLELGPPVLLPGSEPQLTSLR